MAVAAAPVPVGEMLRTWRRRSSLSQLELSLNAGVSSRHLSFLETGRVYPANPRTANRLLADVGAAPAGG
jgi:transcriptional regulator with XRE-family HTH domain